MGRLDLFGDHHIIIHKTQVFIRQRMTKQRDNTQPANFRFIGALRVKAKIPAKVLFQYIKWNPAIDEKSGLNVIKRCVTNYANPNWSKFDTRGHPTRFKLDFESEICEKVNVQVLECKNCGQNWATKDILKAVLLETFNLSEVGPKFLSNFLKRHPLDQNNLLVLDIPVENVKLKQFAPALEFTELGESMLHQVRIEMQREDNEHTCEIVDFDNEDSPVAVTCFEDTVVVVAAQSDGGFDDFQPEDFEAILSLGSSNDDDNDADLLLAFGHSFANDEFHTEESFFLETSTGVDLPFFVSWLNACHRLPILVYQLPIKSDSGDCLVTCIEANSQSNSFIGAVLNTVMMNIYFRSQYLSGARQFICPLHLRHCVVMSVMFDSTTEDLLNYVNSGNADYRLVYPAPLSQADASEVMTDLFSDCIRTCPDQRNFIDVGREATAKLMNIGILLF